MPRLPRPLRLAGLALALGLGLLALAAAAGLAFLHSAAGRDWALGLLGRELLARGEVVLAYREVRGSLLGTLELEGLTLAREGRELFAADELALRPNLPALLGGRVRLGLLRLVRPRVELAALAAGPEAGGLALPLALTVRRLEVVGGSFRAPAAWAPLEALEGIDLRGRLSLDARGPALILDEFALRAKLAGWPAPLAFQGRAELPRGRELVLRAGQLTLGENHLELTGSLAWRRSLAYALHLRGSLDRPDQLPFPWPGPQLPRAPLGLDLTLHGTLRHLDLAGELGGAGQGLQIAGEMDLAEASGGLTARLSGLDLATWGLAPRGLVLTGTASLSFRGWPGRPDAVARLGLDLNRVEDAILGEGSLLAQLSLARRRLEAGQFSLSGAFGRLEGRGYLDLACPACGPGLSLEAEFKDLAPPPGLPLELPPELAGLRLSGRAKLAGSLEEWTGEATLRGVELLPGLKAEELRLAGGHGPAGWRLTLAELDAPWGSLRITGQADRQAADLRFSLALPDPARLAEPLRRRLPGLPALAGRGLSAEGEFKGPWESPALRLAARAESLEAWGHAGRGLALAAHLDQVWPRPLGQASLSLESLHLGSVACQAVELGLRLGAAGEELDLKGAAAGWELMASLDELAWRPPALAARLLRLRLAPPGFPALSLKESVRLAYDGRRLELPGLSFLARDEEVLTVTANYHSDGRLQAEVGLRDLKLRPLLPWEGLDPSARLDLALSVEGSLEVPRISLRGQARRLVLPNLPTMVLNFTGGYRAGLATLEGRLTAAGRPLLEGQASLPGNLGLAPPGFAPGPEGLRADLGVRGLPLALVQPLLPWLRELGGELDLELVARGAPSAPLVTGRMELKRAGFTIADSGQRFEGLAGSARLDQRRLTIEGLRVPSRGALALGGWLDLPLGDPGRLELRLAGEDFLVSLGPWGDSELAVDLALAGDFDHPHLTGELRPKSLRLNLNSAPPADLDEVVMLKPGQEPPPFGGRGGLKPIRPGGLAGRASLAVALNLREGLKVSVDEGWLDLRGEAWARKLPGGPLTYHGQVLANGGVIILRGRRFVVQAGTLDFADKEIPDADISAEATYQSGGTIVFVATGGTLDSPQFQLSSQPPMSQADILSTIIFGRPAGSLSGSEKVRFQAEALALLGQRAAEDMQRIVGRTLAPDIVTVYQQAEGGSSLEAGKYLRPDLYLRYRQNLGESSGRNVGLEYRLRPWLSLESQVGDTRDTGVDVIFNLDFGGK